MEKKAPRKRSPSQFLAGYFARKFSEKFEVPYDIAWGRDCGVFKALLKTYTQEQIEAIIDYTLFGEDSPITTACAPTIFRSGWGPTLAVGAKRMFPERFGVKEEVKKPKTEKKIKKKEKDDPLSILEDV